MQDGRQGQRKVCLQAAVTQTAHISLFHLISILEDDKAISLSYSLSLRREGDAFDVVAREESFKLYCGSGRVEVANP